MKIGPLIELELTGISAEGADLLMVPTILRMASNKEKNKFIVWYPKEAGQEMPVEVTAACFERLRTLLGRTPAAFKVPPQEGEA